MNDALLKSRTLSFLESRHGRQSEAYSVAPFFSCILNQLQQKIIRDAVRGVTPPAHDVACDFAWVD